MEENLKENEESSLEGLNNLRLGGDKWQIKDETGLKGL
jgi:hypothetical protein